MKNKHINETRLRGTDWDTGDRGMTFINTLKTLICITNNAFLKKDL